MTVSEIKSRLFTGWTFVRVLYLLLGVYVSVNAAVAHDWLLGLGGGYFSLMGLFGFGCAGGNCGWRGR